MPDYHEIVAELLTPCCISEQPAMGNEVATLDYIPGAALRGMLADLYLRKGGDADALFRKLFCSDEVSFPNLYPVNHQPLPLSAYTCKRLPGFKNDSAEDDKLRHGVWDLLFEDFTSTCKDRRHNDGNCAGPLKPCEKRWFDGDNVRPRSCNAAAQLLITRTAVQTLTGSALDGSLHTQQELAAGRQFKGNLRINNLTLPGSAKTLAQELFERLGSSSVIAYTGRRRAGQVEIKISEGANDFESDFLPWPAPAGYLYFALTFASDVILIDGLLRPIIALDRAGETLKKEMAFPNDVWVCLEKAFVHTRRVSGWNAVAQIFKPDDVAMAMGSTFLVKIKSSDKATVTVWMERVIAEGVGLRRAEGFGQVRFDEPFHIAAANQHGGGV